jgi:hypothetical protein
LPVPIEQGAKIQIGWAFQIARPRLLGVRQQAIAAAEQTLRIRSIRAATSSLR